MKHKYPRTPHLPWSPGYTSDDCMNTTTHHFEGKVVMITEKLDGECSTLGRDYTHARSLDSRHHPSRNMLKAWHSGIAHNIPEGWRVCGENVFAAHSIHYTNLEAYFYLFSVWDENNVCLDWSETLKWADILGCPTPRLLWSGIWDEQYVRRLKVDTATTEGYVVRTYDQFEYQWFHQHVNKWVRPNHVATDTHWMHGPIIQNTLS